MFEHMPDDQQECARHRVRVIGAGVALILGALLAYALVPAEYAAAMGGVVHLDPPPVTADGTTFLAGLLAGGTTVAAVMAGLWWLAERAGWRIAPPAEEALRIRRERQNRAARAGRALERGARAPGLRTRRPCIVRSRRERGHSVETVEPVAKVECAELRVDLDVGNLRWTIVGAIELLRDPACRRRHQLHQADRAGR